MTRYLNFARSATRCQPSRNRDSDLPARPGPRAGRNQAAQATVTFNLKVTRDCQWPAVLRNYCRGRSFRLASVSLVTRPGGPGLRLASGECSADACLCGGLLCGRRVNSFTTQGIVPVDRFTVTSRVNKLERFVIAGLQVLDFEPTVLLRLIGSAERVGTAAVLTT